MMVQINQLFSPEQVALFEKRHEEGFDVRDAEYEVWLKLYHTNSFCSAK
jgi:hypothetical protein